jgi:hypothetical protein
LETKRLVISGILSVEEQMNLKKNAGAKIAAVVASLFALLIGWGLVHQNPPVPVSADSAASTSNVAPAANSGVGGGGVSQQVAPAPRPRRVRTHVS